MSPDNDADEFLLLGIAIFCAQRVEFTLYGIAAHAAHTPSAKARKHFRELTPEKFLRGDVGDLKATFGQLVESFGDAFLIKTQDLIDFYKDRNLIAHDYVRIFRSDIKGVPKREGGKEFLLDFIERAQKWEKILYGFLCELISAAAEKEGRLTKVKHTTKNLEAIEAYREQAIKYTINNQSNTQTSTLRPTE